VGRGSFLEDHVTMGTPYRGISAFRSFAATKVSAPYQVAAKTWEDSITRSQHMGCIDSGER
jgi:hypothetical protein